MTYQGKRAITPKKRKKKKLLSNLPMNSLS